VPFVDGIERDVFEDADGRQYVLGRDGEKLYGTWLHPADAPIVVPRHGRSRHDRRVRAPSAPQVVR
jgi:hypothetical protein